MTLKTDLSTGKYLLALFFLLFLFQSCSTNHEKNNEDVFLITSKSIGLAKLGQPLDELKKQYKDCIFSNEPVWLYGMDGGGEGIKISKDNEDLLFVWTKSVNDKIYCISALSKKYHTINGFRPAFTTAGELKRRYPKLKLDLSLEFPELEYASIDSLIFVFKQVDSTHVGTYNIPDETSSAIFDTSKVITRIEITNE